MLQNSAPAYSGFSGKKKKIQLQNKRQRKKNEMPEEEASKLISKTRHEKHTNYADNRKQHYITVLADSEASIKAEKMKKFQPIRIADSSTEIDPNLFYPDELGFPVRPKRNKDMTKEQLYDLETNTFQTFIDDIEMKYGQTLGYYERNYETWTTLWKVVNMSDIVIFITDIRYCGSQVPLKFIHHLNGIGKKVLLVISKCDLVPAETTLSWMQYYEQNVPGLLAIPYSSAEGHDKKSSRISISEKSSLLLLDACDKIMDYKVDLSELRTRIQRAHENDMYLGEVKNKKNVELTIGVTGFPNVGKSSLINSVFGKKLVKVKGNAGCTKTLVPMAITEKIMLCDCPGLIFPSVCSKAWQVAMGTYPASQCRVPEMVVGHIAERIDLPKILQLPHQEEWTPYKICEAYAELRKLYTKNGGPDAFRAALFILKVTNLGQKGIEFFFKPKNFSCDLDDERLKVIKSIISISENCVETRRKCKKRNRKNWNL